MSIATAKTLLGFVRASIEKALPILGRNRSVEQIYNYLPIDGLYATSGQPNKAQLSLIHEAGYEVVINLAPNSVIENSVVEERKILTELGVQYIHIPVNFKDPSDKKFNQFRHAIDTSAGRKVWVHCAANMRVSAFTYRYRTQVLKHDAAEARSDMHKIWAPIGVWKRFIS